MPELTKEEVTFIVQVLSQLSWKTGQSSSNIMAERIIRKCGEGIEQKPIKEGE